MKCHAFRTLCPSSVRSGEPSLENQCSLLSSGAGVTSVHSSHLHPMSVTNLALQVLLFVDGEWGKVELRTFSNHLHYSNSLKQSPAIRKETILSRATCRCLRIRICNDPSDHLWLGCDWEVAGLKSRILYSQSSEKSSPAPVRLWAFRAGNKFCVSGWAEHI